MADVGVGVGDVDDVAVPLPFSVVPTAAPPLFVVPGIFVVFPAPPFGSILPLPPAVFEAPHNFALVQEFTQ